MKKTLLTLSMILTLPLHAAEISFSYFGNEGSGSNSTYYSCSYVEDQASYFLNMLGAQKVRVLCTGGLQNWGWTPINLTAKFETPTINGDNIESVEIHSDPWDAGCTLNTRLINDILKNFNNIEVVEKHDTCPFQDSNYYYLLKIQH
jgi:hypothetical protein